MPPTVLCSGTRKNVDKLIDGPLGLFGSQHLLFWLAKHIIDLFYIIEKTKRIWAQIGRMRALRLATDAYRPRLISIPSPIPSGHALPPRNVKEPHRIPSGNLVSGDGNYILS